MVFGDLFRDIYSRLSLDGDEHDIYYDDISKAINDAIREIRVEYIQQGLGHEFATTESLSSFTEDTNYPFVNSDTLSSKVMQDLPIEFTVLSSTCFNTSNTIDNTTQTFNKGDTARKGRDLYECVESFSGVNTFDLVFDPTNVRNYYRANGLKYDEGDIVFDTEGESYYKVNTGFTNDQDIDADSVSELDKIYWKRIGTADIYASHYPFKFIHAMRVFEDIDFSEAISILDDKVYATPNITEVNLTYVSKWSDIKDKDATLDLPDFMIPAVKDRALVRIGQKLNVEIQLLEQEQNE